jgi:site-specific recombinase
MGIGGVTVMALTRNLRIGKIQYHRSIRGLAHLFYIMDKLNIHFTGCGVLSKQPQHLPMII